MTLYRIVYQHCDHEWKPFRFVCDECGMIEIPTPSGKMGRLFVVPVEPDLQEMIDHVEYLRGFRLTIGDMAEVFAVGIGGDDE